MRTRLRAVRNGARADEVRERRAQLRERERLIEKRVDAGGASPIADDLTVAADHENRRARALMASHPLHELETAHARQHKIGDNDVEEHAVGQKPERGLSVVHGGHVANRLEHEGEQRADVTVVVRNERTTPNLRIAWKKLHDCSFGRFVGRASRRALRPRKDPARAGPHIGVANTSMR